MRIRVNKAHFPVTTLGPGRRIGVWLQGCHVACADCCSRDTWAPEGGYDIHLDDLLAWCREVGREGFDGITITGGEPFEQPEELTELLDRLICWRDELQQAFDILCYSGLSVTRLEARYGDILPRIDALIPEPFIAGRPLSRAWRGSSNQPLLPLTPLGIERYPVGAEHRRGKRLQVAVEGGAVWCIGIPERGDLHRLESALRERGVVLDEVSWRA